MHRLLVALALTGALILPSAAYADDRDFNLVNNSSSAINGLFVSPSDDDLWGDNILTGPVPPGEARGIFFDGEFATCVYDVRVEFVDGSSGELRDLDLCGITSITLDDEFITAN